MNVPKWNLPGDLISASVEAMRPSGARGNEGLALWLGNECDGNISVTHIVRPVGPGLTENPLHLSLSMRAISRITSLTDKLGVYWVGQIHSHPERYVDLSRVDRAMGVKVQDYLSVVCPFYAQAYTEHLHECGVHVFDQGSYRRLPPKEVTARFRLTPTQAVFIQLEVPA